MRYLLALPAFSFFFSAFALADMVSNKSIANDPAMEKLCATRAKAKPVPFEIDSAYVASSRSIHPDATFIATDGISPQLVECYLREGTGKFEPASFSPEQAFWHLPRPKQFEPGINTPKGISMAAEACLQAVPTKINRPNIDHSVYSSVIEISASGPRYHSGALIAGKKADRYDIAVLGTSFFKAAGPDLEGIGFTCLLSPMLEIKAIQFK